MNIPVRQSSLGSDLSSILLRIKHRFYKFQTNFSSLEQISSFYLYYYIKFCCDHQRYSNKNIANFKELHYKKRVGSHFILNFAPALANPHPVAYRDQIAGKKSECIINVREE